MKPPYWLYLETPLEQKYLEQLVRWDFYSKILNNNDFHKEEAEKILKRLESM